MGNWPSTGHFHYRFGKPCITGTLKSGPQDFKVTELLPFEPSGEGEHLFLKIRKTNLNTAYVAEELARFFNIKASQVRYAGRKDKLAETTQWFSVHINNKPLPILEEFPLVGVDIVEATRNRRQLKLGSLLGNHFEITIRDLHGHNTEEGIAERLALINTYGVPNYFGDQRFGHSYTLENPPPFHKTGGNLLLADRMLAGEAIKNRNKRNITISALRSWLFNHVLSARLISEQGDAVHFGDAVQLSGTQSFFTVSEQDDLEQMNRRFRDHDLSFTCPLWGRGDLHTSGSIADFELGCVDLYQPICQQLERLDMKQDRRKAICHPTQLSWKIENNCLMLSFFLPAGSFATSIIRELIDTECHEYTNE